MAKHAFLAASASERWLRCPPSAKLCAQEEDQGSPYAQQGTDAHELCQYLLEKAIGENTTECMQSGIVFGTAAMLDGLIKRISNELGYENVTVVATGGYSPAIIPSCETDIIYDENLLLDGLREIYLRAE